MKPPSFRAPDGLPPAEPWDEADQADAAALIGKYALVGMAWPAKSGEAFGQYHGRIVSADPEGGIVVACEGAFEGERLVLPPSPGYFKPAQPGEYRLRATGETVVSPDVVSTWRISRDGTPESVG